MAQAQRRPAPPGVTLRAEELESRYTPAVAIRFDYTYDTAGFFNDPAKRAALQAAADQIGPYLQDDLAAVTSSGANTWTATVFDPATNSTVSIPNLVVNHNEMVVYVGSGAISAEDLALATTGGYSASGTAAWLNTVKSRGKGGALTVPQTAYADWGGMITFDADTNWYAGTGTPAVNQYDLTSVSIHELMHIFGFGMGEPAFAHDVTNWNGSTGLFVGPNAEAAYGGPVPVTGDSGAPDHWAPTVRVGGAEPPMLPALTAGTTRRMTAIDYAALADIGWAVAAPAAPTNAAASTAPASPPAAAAAPVTASANTATPVAAVWSNGSASTAAIGRRFAAGTEYGAAVYDSTGQPVTSAPAYPGEDGAVRVATADVTGDGTPDLVTGSAPGVPNRVTVTDGKTGATLVTFEPFEASFTGGVFVAVGDFTGDGRPDVVVTPDQSGGPVVAVYDGAAAGLGQVVQVSRFFGIADPTFRGGARIAVGDVNGDGTPDLVVAAGTGGGPRVGVIDGASVRTGQPVALVPDFFAFEPSLRNGAYVAVVDLAGDGTGDVAAGAGPGGAPRVTVFRGRDLLAGNKAVAADFFAGPLTSRGGARVAAADLDGDGRDDLITAAGDGSTVNAYAAKDLAAGTVAPFLTRTVPAGGDGVNVG